MYKEDLVLNNLQWLICHKTQKLTYNTGKKYGNPPVFDDTAQYSASIEFASLIASTSTFS